MGKFNSLKIRHFFLTITLMNESFIKISNQMKKKHGDHIECFGVRHNVGDVVGCFLNADTHCISKRRKR